MPFLTQPLNIGGRIIRSSNSNLDLIIHWAAPNCYGSWGRLIFYDEDLQKIALHTVGIPPYLNVLPGVDKIFYIDQSARDRVGEWGNQWPACMGILDLGAEWGLALSLENGTHPWTPLYSENFGAGGSPAPNKWAKPSKKSGQQGVTAPEQGTDARLWKRVFEYEKNRKTTK